MNPPWNPADGSINGKWLKWGAFNSQSVYFELSLSVDYQTSHKGLQAGLKPKVMKFKSEDSAKCFVCHSDSYSGWTAAVLGPKHSIWSYDEARGLFLKGRKQALDVVVAPESRELLRKNLKNLRRLDKDKSDITNYRERWVSFQLSTD